MLLARGRAAEAIKKKVVIKSHVFKVCGNEIIKLIVNCNIDFVHWILVLFFLNHAKNVRQGKSIAVVYTLCTY